VGAWGLSVQKEMLIINWEYQELQRWLSSLKHISTPLGDDGAILPFRRGSPPSVLEVPLPRQRPKERAVLCRIVRRQMSLL